MEEKIAFNDIESIMDIDLDQWCTFKPINEPHLLGVPFDGGLSAGLILSADTHSWYQTSLLNINLDKEDTPRNNNTYINNNQCKSSLFTSTHMSNQMPMLAITPKMPSSSVHDQHPENMIANFYSKSINSFDLDNSTWSQEQCWKGSICESKPSNIYHPPCSNKGFNDVIYPNELTEPSFLNKSKMEQLPLLFNILMPSLPSYKNDNNNNNNPKLNGPYLHQNQNVIANILENAHDKTMIQNDFEKNLAWIHEHSLQVNPTHQTYESIKEDSFSHDIKNVGLNAQYSFQYVNDNMVSENAPTTQGYSTQTSLHQSSKERKRKNQHPKRQPLKKGKLAERITILQQLVSPFGKIDQASILSEAMRCIKFLQDKVQVLSSPYLKGPSTRREDEVQLDLKSKGLCLVPFSCTLHIANENGEDLLYERVF